MPMARGKDSDGLRDAKPSLQEESPVREPTRQDVVTRANDLLLDQGKLVDFDDALRQAVNELGYKGNDLVVPEAPSTPAESTAPSEAESGNAEKSAQAASVENIPAWFPLLPPHVQKAITGIAGSSRSGAEGDYDKAREIYEQGISRKAAERAGKVTSNSVSAEFMRTDPIGRARALGEKALATNDPDERLVIAEQIVELVEEMEVNGVSKDIVKQAGVYLVGTLKVAIIDGHHTGGLNGLEERFHEIGERSVPFRKYVAGAFGEALTLIQAEIAGISTSEVSVADDISGRGGSATRWCSL